ncbi:MAG: glycosyltransferase family 2 protein [Gemmatimonadaceae bacterium]|jgi:chlorobactene glucosyltransferase|nr:glycosyltransferase family 2 protein [Gemmatimonadaceae bacterium]
MALAIAFVLVLPWLVPALVVRRRMGALVALETYAESVPDAPTVSVILPARNEARHIRDCVRSILGSSYPALELIVVDDHSTDGTAALAREAAPDDPRLHVVHAPDLPAGWFGKQWACATGAAHATGSLLLFTDADTRHAPGLVGRMARCLRDRNVALLSVAGTQEMRTVWERAIQPVIFLLLLTRYGSTHAMERATSPLDVIGNGQCFLIDRVTYDRIGGHAAVRDTVAEDLMIAQTVHQHGGRVSLVTGTRHLSTRMYQSLPELVHGWGKNIYAGGRLAMPWGTLGQWLFPLLLVAFPLALLAPFVAIPLALLTAHTALVIWALLAAAATLATVRHITHREQLPASATLLFPLGALLTLVIAVRAIARGRQVEWKGRRYTSR